MKELTITEQEAAYEVARQRVVVCEGRCEVTAIKRRLATATDDLVKAKTDIATASTSRSQHSYEVNRQKNNLLAAVSKLTGRIANLAEKSLAELNERESELRAEILKQEGEVWKIELNPAQTEFAAKDRALRDWIKRQTNVQYVPLADREACGAWSLGKLNELKTARDKHWAQGTVTARDRFPPSMRLYTGVKSGIKKPDVDNETNRALAQAVDAAEASIDAVVDELSALKTQYSDQRAATAEALVVAERAHQDTTNERGAARATFSQLQTAESRIVDKVEKARKHVEVATQEAVVAEVNARYDETSKAVTAAKKNQADLEYALAAVKDAESWWIPFQKSVHALQAAERELWLAGEGLRMWHQARQEAIQIKTLADAVMLLDLACDRVATLACQGMRTKRMRPKCIQQAAAPEPIPQTPESARLLLVALAKPITDVQEGLREARTLNPRTDVEHWAHVTALLYALYRSDEDLAKAQEQLPTKLAAFDKADSDPAGTDALATLREAKTRQRAAETKIKELNMELAESTKRLAAQQETMAELEELWELAKARLALRQLTPSPSC